MSKVSTIADQKANDDTTALEGINWQMHAVEFGGAMSQAQVAKYTGQMVDERLLRPIRIAISATGDSLPSELLTLPSETIDARFNIPMQETRDAFVAHHASYVKLRTLRASLQTALKTKKAADDDRAIAQHELERALLNGVDATKAEDRIRTATADADRLDRNLEIIRRGAEQAELFAKRSLVQALRDRATELKTELDAEADAAGRELAAMIAEPLIRAAAVDFARQAAHRPADVIDRLSQVS